MLQVQSSYPSKHTFQSAERPSHEEYAAMARWLVSQNTWGVLSTISKHLNGSPFGNVLSFSDGPSDRASGQPYFYLTALDPSLTDTEEDSRCSLTIAEAALGTCGNRDPESPACAKLTLSGQMKQVEEEELDFAREALFSKHDEMQYWPKGHHFQFYKLQIEDVFLIDWFGGAQPISLDEYFRAHESGQTDVLRLK